MDPTLHRHCARFIYIIPDGLKELMSDISREVLRSQPDNIYTFIADYLDALLITRENARVAAQLVQQISEVSETIVEFLNRTQMSIEEADRVVTIIQNAFRGYIQRKHPPHENEEDEFIARILEEAQISEELVVEAAKVIQNAYRKFMDRKAKEEQLLSGIIDWRVAARSAIQLYRKTGVSTEEAHRAATLIKAAYKGYYTRRMIKRLAEKTVNQGFDEESVADEEVDLDRESQDNRPKAVRINFETVKPRVDFDESPIITDEEREGTKTIAREILEQIFKAAVPIEEEPTPTAISQSETSEDHLPMPEPKPSFRQPSTDIFIKHLLMEKIVDPIFKDESPGGQEKEVVEKLFVKEYIAPLGDEDLDESQVAPSESPPLESARSDATSAPTETTETHMETTTDTGTDVPTE